MKWCANNIRPAIAHAHRVLPKRVAYAVENQLRELQHKVEYCRHDAVFSDLTELQREKAEKLARDVLTLR